MKTKRKHLRTAACAALAASAFLAAPGSVHAETSDVPVTINYSAAAACRGPSVMIPKEIYMKDEMRMDYSVWAYCEKSELGTLFDHVTVEPSESFTLTNEKTGETFTASVTQLDTLLTAEMVKAGKEYDLDGTPVMRKETEGSISVDGIGEGRWTGAMTFHINEIAHDHRWVVPVMSADGLTLEKYACPCGEESHVHRWNEGIMQGTWIKARRCACGETIQAEDYDILRDTEQAMQDTVMEKWIAKNITPGMTNLEKAKEIAAEMNSYTHIATLPEEEQKGISCLEKTGSCLGGNNMFAKYCKAVGIEAKVFGAGQYVGGEHYLTYVWPDGQGGEKLIADATPGGGITGPGTLWTEDGLWLYCDLLDGIVTDEEFDQWIVAEER